MIDIQCFETSGTWIKPEWADGVDGHVLLLARPASGEHPPRIVALTFDGDRSTDEWPDMPAWAMFLMMENEDRLFDRGVAGQVSTYGGRAYVTALRGGGGGTIIGSGGVGGAPAPVVHPPPEAAAMSTTMWLVEDHRDMAGVPFRDDGPPCITNGWCCGCAVHPLGKPWGWNSAAWDEHYATHHDQDAPGRP